ncbi:transmembrane amino acid transporter protein [Ancylostoma ceylanicum]|uniref:Transmembrane amino acid transporter protein n=1 Tax=Ancylostoma ceylanicum TaxID=53326 RepID=A0A0D6LBW4_9BILA|nr:transmembrane amino acid transporter protein [Ancylostoma ceylanicum]
MQKRWPKYLKTCRSPYAEMAQRAIGGKASLLAHAMIQITLFGGASVFSLLAARNISDLLHLFGASLHFCLCLFAVSLFLWPFMMLRSPMHFWQVSIGAALSTTVAVILILIGTSIDVPICFQAASYAEVTPRQFTLGFGTIVFAYGGHPVFPTIQHDMRQPRHFSKAVMLSYIVLFLLYAPVAIGGYAVYGTSLTDSIVSSIQSRQQEVASHRLMETTGDGAGGEDSTPRRSLTNDIPRQSSNISRSICTDASGAPPRESPENHCWQMTEYVLILFCDVRQIRGNYDETGCGRESSRASLV